MDLKRHAYEYFRMKGFADHQAAALAAHMDQESGGNTRAVHDKGTGLGIYGWRDPVPGQGRKTALINWATKNNLDPHALNTQLDFAVHELGTSERAAGERLRAAKTYQEAINAGMAYLRPAGYTPDNPSGGHNYTGRYNAGAQLAGVQPLTGDAVAAAGGNNAPSLPAGLLTESTPAPATPIDGAKVDKEKEEAAFYEQLSKKGTAMMAAEEAPAPPVQPASAGGLLQAPNPVPLPDFTKPAPSLPDFLEMLSQQRLRRA